MLPELESAVLKYATSRTIAVDHTRHGAVGTRKRYRGAASRNSKDASTAAYNAVYNKIHRDTIKRDPVNEAFGIWTSRSLVINANTNNHKDLEDVFHGWCAIVVLGTLRGVTHAFQNLGSRLTALWARLLSYARTRLSITSVPMWVAGIA